MPADDTSHPTVADWLRNNFSRDDGRENELARAVRAENDRRQAVHLARCPRASRTS